MSKKRLLIGSIVVAELVLFLFLGYRLITVIRQRNGVLGEQNIVRLHKEDFVFSNNETLRYYYEYIPHAENTDDWSYLTEPVVNRTNSEGMNTTREYEIPKPANIFRIIALGDSFTYGLHVNTGYSWTDRLESMLNSESTCSSRVEFEVLNMGVPGHDIPYEVQNFRLHGVKYQPDLVLWMLLANDFSDINEFMRPIANTIYEKMEKDNSLDPVNGWVIPMEKAREEMMKTYTMDKIFRMLDAHISTFSSLYNGSLVMMTFSPFDSVLGQKILSWTTERKNSFYDNALPDMSALHLTLRDGHPSKEGHKIIAESIYQYLVSNNLTPCN